MTTLLTLIACCKRTTTRKCFYHHNEHAVDNIELKKIQPEQQSSCQQIFARSNEQMMSMYLSTAMTSSILNHVLY